MSDYLYLEISGRGTGKTYRMLQTIADWLRASDSHRARLIVPYTRAFRVTRDALDKWMRERVIDATTASKEGEVVRAFYDEFDWIGDFTLSQDYSGYYVTGPSRTRSVDELLDPNTLDPLIKLLRLNHGQYVSYSVISHVFPSVLLRDARRELADDIFKREYLAQFIS